MRCFRFCYCALGFGLGAVAAAPGQSFLPIDQSRYIAASTFIGSGESGDQFDDQSDGANDFGPYAGSVVSTLTSDPPEATAMAAANQVSQLGAMLITASGDVSASAGTRVATTLSGLGESGFSYTFTLDQAGEVLLDGFVSESDDNLAFATVGLFDSDNNTVASFDAFGDVAPFSFTQMLAAGDYRLEALAATSVDNGSAGAAAFSLSFSVPEPTSAALLAGGATMLLRRKR